MALQFCPGGYGLQATGDALIRKKKGGVATALPAANCEAPVPEGAGRYYLGFSIVR
jgi:hypothetical protein